MSDFCPFCRHQRLGMAQLRPHCQNCQRRMHCTACETLLRSDGSCEHCQPLRVLDDQTWSCTHRPSGYACRTRSVFEARGVESHDLERCTACGLYYVTFTDDAGNAIEAYDDADESFVAAVPKPMRRLNGLLTELAERARGVDVALAALLPATHQPNVRVVEDYLNAKTFDVRLDGVRLRVIVGVEVHEDQLWAHLSVSAQRPARLPSWKELRWCKEYFIGDRKAIQVLPARAEYVNLHPHVLNLYAPLDRDPLPDFRVIIERTGEIGL